MYVFCLPSMCQQPWANIGLPSQQVGWSSVSRQRARAWPCVTEVRLGRPPRRCRLAGLAEQRPRRRRWLGESMPWTGWALQRRPLAVSFPSRSTGLEQGVEAPAAAGYGAGLRGVRERGELGRPDQGLGCGLGAPASSGGWMRCFRLRGGGAEERFPTSSDCFESWRWRHKQFSCWLAEQVRRGGAEGRGPGREGGPRARLLRGKAWARSVGQPS